MPQQRTCRRVSPASLVCILAGLLLWPSAAWGQVAGAQAGAAIQVVVGGRSIPFDVPPVVENGRTLVPVRAIMEALGASVTWDGATQVVTATREGVQVQFAIGYTVARVNGYAVYLDVPAKIMQGRTLVPVRFLSESLGFGVSWDGATGTIRIDSRPAGGTASAGAASDVPSGPKPPPPPAPPVSAPASPSPPVPKPAPAPRAVSPSAVPIKGPQPTGNAIVQDNPFRSLAVSWKDANVVYFGSEGNGMFKSSDGGRTWQWLRAGLPYTLGFQTYAETYDIAVDPRDDATLVAAATNGPGPAAGDYPSAIGGFYRSTDAGQTWTRRMTGLSNGAVLAVAVDATNSSHIVVGTDGGPVSFTGSDVSGQQFPGGLWSTTDAGETWRRLPLPERALTNRFIEIYIRGQNPVRIYSSGIRWTPGEPGQPSRPDLTGSTGLMRSDDGGETWRQISPANAFVLRFDVTAGGNILYAVAESSPGVLYSADGGATWQTRSAPGSRVVRMSSGDGRTVFLAGYDNALYKSTDGLATVRRVMAADNTITDIEVAASDPKIVYVSTYGLVLYRSTDGGETFTRMANLRDFINAQ